ncbi:MAG: heme ABC exporter ATP-binding protein CcmA [Acidobacteriota bacterium]|jgi:heme exporter protein A|nr:heme ABC exporter ATP-binding protein CcmA [Acidobacteriota bacterium]
MIKVRGLAKYYGRFTALRALDLDIGAGECVALFGRNGAGKTTLLRILAGLSRPSSGSFQIKFPGSASGKGAASPRGSRGRIGYLSHNTSLYPDLTALENLRFFAGLMDAPADEESLARRMEAVGLAGREREPVRNFSRGMQQRLAIARAFLHDPELLLLDEPFTGLDRLGFDVLGNYIRRARGAGKTCLVALHDLDLGYALADRLVVIEKGVAALDAPKASLTPAGFEERFRKIMEGGHA